jgi:predicted TIM-barrel fold metal-dependent hydrolase
MPPPFTSSDYANHPCILAGLANKGGAIVSGSFQLYDQTYLVDALQKLGPLFVGVTQVLPSVTDEELMFLHSKRVRAIRFNLKRGVCDTGSIKELATRVFDLAQMHSEFYIDSSLLDTVELFDLLQNLPRIVIDHMGLSHAGFDKLFRLLDHSCLSSPRNVFVKLTGFSRFEGTIDHLRSTLVRLIKEYPDQGI